ncbi:DUF5343 domain-containing protein [Citrobacter sp. Cpo074]|uniref:hypothetical protein n=1 Tax=Citrobacter sp. Cpo074 TaxID=2985135 RepID=UPI002576B165|nr:hypothetical protein [Citrobacter sp. Cpo074]MDM2848812.1 DUF5343 domain-containing protein [Citrobacter sp. Cpo074]
MSSNQSDFQNIIGRLKTSGIQRNFKTYSGDIVTDMNKVFNSYQGLLQRFLDSEGSGSSLYRRLANNLGHIKALSNSIETATKEFLEGNIRRSYNTFSDALDEPEIRINLRQLTKNLGSWSNRITPTFRLRASPTPLLKREEMFHISFSMRERVKTQRYSVEGLPCIYLGTSLYICWQELGCPDFDKLYISAFRASREAKNLGILNLAYTLDSLKENNLSRFFDFDPINEEIQLAYLTIWPLVIACSYLKKNKNASFNPEYIIPNLLMQKISSDRNMEIAGIAYYSTKSEKMSSDAFGVNIVLPPQASYQDMKDYNFCPHLAESMRVTNPVPWSLLSTLKFESMTERYVSEHDIDDIYETLLKSYDATEFKILEDNISEHFKFAEVENKKVK